MKPKKIFIISLNNLSLEFWKNTFNFGNSSIWHWKNAQHGINNLTTIWPDLIIIDGYWAKENKMACLRKVLSIVSSAKIFFLTPLPKGPHGTVILDSRLFVSKLDNEVIDEINYRISNRIAPELLKKGA
jgi:hypothetical protein